MKHRTILSAFMGLFIVMVITITSSVGASAGLFRQDSLTATLSELEGDVQFRDSESGQFAAASNGQSIPVGGQVQTGANGRARLDLSSGTIVRVAPSSLFTLESNESTSGGLLTQFNLAVGQLWVILNGGQLDINSGAGVASVRGSYLSVSVTKNSDGTYSINLQCAEGNCSFTDEAGNQLEMTTGQALDLTFDPVTNTIEGLEITPMTQAEIAEWLANVIEFQDILDFVLDAIEQLQNTEPGTTVTGTVGSLPSTNSGSFASNSQFSLGAAQVTINDPLPGIVTASVIKQNQFVVAQTKDNLGLISHGLSIEMSGKGYVRVCFAYPPVKPNINVVKWNPPSGNIQGEWIGMDTYRNGPVICSDVPAGIFALAGSL